jgi:hypothetical protein
MPKGLQRTLKRARLKGGTLKPSTIPIDLTVAVADGAPGFGTAVIRGLPRGRLLLLGSAVKLVFTRVGTAITATFDGDFSIGTAATIDADFGDTGEANIIASTAMGAATAGVSPTLAATANTAAMLDNTAGDLELNLNVLIDDAAISGADSLRAQGTLNIAFLEMGT